MREILSLVDHLTEDCLVDSKEGGVREGGDRIAMRAKIGDGEAAEIAVAKPRKPSVKKDHPGMRPRSFPNE